MSLASRGPWQHLVAGERTAAEALARVLLAQDPRDVRSLCLLAESAAGQGRGEAAKAWLGQALALDPYDAEARSLLERMSHSPRPAGAALRRWP